MLHSPPLQKINTVRDKNWPVVLLVVATVINYVMRLLKATDQFVTDSVLNFSKGI